MTDSKKLPDIFSKLPDFSNRDFDYNPKPTDADRIAFQNAKAQAAALPFQQRPRLNFKYDRSLTGHELAESLKQSLLQQGINPQDVMIRVFSKNRQQAAIQTGSDRDHQSNVAYNGATDGEQEWMRGLGIRGNDQVTFVSPIGNWLTGGSDAPKAHDTCYVIYDKKFLYKVGHASNGFHAFLSTPQRALVGFISDEGTIPLALSSKSQPQTIAEP